MPPQQYLIISQRKLHRHPLAHDLPHFLKRGFPLRGPEEAFCPPCCLLRGSGKTSASGGAQWRRIPMNPPPSTVFLPRSHHPPSRAATRLSSRLPRIPLFQQKALYHLRESSLGNSPGLPKAQTIRRHQGTSPRQPARRMRHLPCQQASRPRKRGTTSPLHQSQQAPLAQ